MKINLILLAAGNSKRFNGNKLLTMINDKPMYMHIVDKVININFNKVVIVTQYEEIKNKLLNHNIDIIINRESFLGISNSIKLGINHDKSADAYMFMVCDQPFISEKTIDNLVNTFKSSDKGIACISYNNETFNPVIFSSAYIDKLLNLTGDIGGKKILKDNLIDVEFTKVIDEKEVIDVDTREDAKNLIY